MGIDVTGQGVKFLLEIDGAAALKSMRQFQSGMQTMAKGIETVVEQTQQGFTRILDNMEKVIRQTERAPGIVFPFGAGPKSAEAQRRLRADMEKLRQETEKGFKTMRQGINDVTNGSDTLINSLGDTNKGARELGDNLEAVAMMGPRLKALAGQLGISLGIGAIASRSVELSNSLEAMAARLGDATKGSRELKQELISTSGASDGFSSNITGMMNSLVQLGVTSGSTRKRIMEDVEKFSNIFKTERGPLVAYFAEMVTRGQMAEDQIDNMSAALTRLQDAKYGPGSIEQDVDAMRQSSAAMRLLDRQRKSMGMGEEQRQQMYQYGQLQMAGLGRAGRKAGLDESTSNLQNVFTQIPSMMGTGEGSRFVGALGSLSGINPQEFIGEIVRTGRFDKVGKALEDAAEKFPDQLSAILTPDVVSTMTGGVLSNPKDLIFALKDAKEKGVGLADAMKRIADDTAKAYQEQKALNEQWDKFKQTLGGKWNEFGALWDRILTKLTVIFEGPMTSMLDWMIKISKKFEDLIDYVNSWGAGLAFVQGLIKGIGVLVLGAGVVGAFSLMKASVLGLGTALMFLMNPIKGVTTAWANLLSKLGLVSKVKEAAVDAANAVKSVAPAAGGVTEAVAEAGNATRVASTGVGGVEAASRAANSAKAATGTAGAMEAATEATNAVKTGSTVATSMGAAAGATKGAQAASVTERLADLDRQADALLKAGKSQAALAVYKQRLDVLQAAKRASSGVDAAAQTVKAGAGWAKGLSEAGPMAKVAQQAGGASTWWKGLQDAGQMAGAVKAGNGAVPWAAEVSGVAKNMGMFGRAAETGKWMLKTAAESGIGKFAAGTTKLLGKMQGPLSVVGAGLTAFGDAEVARQKTGSEAQAKGRGIGSFLGTLGGSIAGGWAGLKVGAAAGGLVGGGLPGALVGGAVGLATGLAAPWIGGKTLGAAGQWIGSFFDKNPPRRVGEDIGNGIKSAADHVAQRMKEAAEAGSNRTEAAAKALKEAGEAVGWEIRTAAQTAAKKSEDMAEGALYKRLIAEGRAIEDRNKSIEEAAIKTAAKLQEVLKKPIEDFAVDKEGYTKQERNMLDMGIKSGNVDTMANAANYKALREAGMEELQQKIREGVKPQDLQSLDVKWKDQGGEEKTSKLTQSAIAEVYKYIVAQNRNVTIPGADKSAQVAESNKDKGWAPQLSGFIDPMQHLYGSKGKKPGKGGLREASDEDREKGIESYDESGKPLDALGRRWRPKPVFERREMAKDPRLQTMAHGDLARDNKGATSTPLELAKEHAQSTSGEDLVRTVTELFSGKKPIKVDAPQDQVVSAVNQLRETLLNEMRMARQTGDPNGPLSGLVDTYKARGF